MPAPIIPELPNYPNPTDPVEVFDAAATATMQELPGVVVAMNELAAWMAGTEKVIIFTATSNAVSANSGALHVFTYAGEKTFTFRPESTHPMPDNARLDLYNYGTGDLELEQGSGVTIIPPAGGTLFIAQNAAVSVIKIDDDEWIVIGATVAA